jgi:hypothetical protein
MKKENIIEKEMVSPGGKEPFDLWNRRKISSLKDMWP